MAYAEHLPTLAVTPTNRHERNGNVGRTHHRRVQGARPRPRPRPGRAGVAPCRRRPWGCRAGPGGERDRHEHRGRRHRRRRLRRRPSAGPRGRRSQPGRPRPAGEQRERARAEPTTAPGPLPRRGLRASLGRERDRAAAVDATGPAAVAGLGRMHRQHHLGRGRRGIRRMGRLRLLEGGPRPAEQRPRRRAPRAADLLGRPGRHANPDAPGGVSGRGHLRPASSRRQRARAAARHRRTPPERPAPGAGARPTRRP